MYRLPVVLAHGMEQVVALIQSCIHNFRSMDANLEMVAQTVM